MKFLLDQSADFRLAAFLRDRAHDVTTIGRDYPSGLADEEVLAIATREQRTLITSDRDFGELAIYFRYAHAGIILFRLDETDVELKRYWLEQVIERYRDEMHHFIVIRNRGIHVRRD